MGGAYKLQWWWKARSSSFSTISAHAQECDSLTLSTDISKSRWLLPQPDSQVHMVKISRQNKSESTWSPNECKFLLDADPSLHGSLANITKTDERFYIIRDDLLHPIMGGNKLRKMDALVPCLEAAAITDVVTCGGCQSAHTTALAVACAERGIRAHLLLRGEQPSIPTGYNLMAKMFGDVTYIPRHLYADREKMLMINALEITGNDTLVAWQEILKGFQIDSAIERSIWKRLDDSDFPRHHKRVAIVKEGASDVMGLIGLIRLVNYLAKPSVFGSTQKLQLVVDSGTGTTAIGMALGILLFRLPWEVIGVKLAGSTDYYKGQEETLLRDFRNQFPRNKSFDGLSHLALGQVLCWIDRQQPRKFGRIVEGDIKACRTIAHQTGVLVDPIYTLAAWEVCMDLCLRREAMQEGKKVVLLHTGGTMSLFGLAQRYPADFC